jgi:hypothetical protein
MSLLDRLLKIDRRWIYLFIALGVTFPLFLHVREEVPVTPEVRGIYEAIEKLPAGSRVLLACDYDPGTAAEIQPMTVTFLKQALSRGLRVVVVGLWPQGPIQANQALEEAKKDPRVALVGVTYGVNYVNLGYQAGNEVAIQRMGSDITAVFPRDMRGDPVDRFPIMQGVHDFSSFAYVMNVSSGYPGLVEWVQFAGDRFHATIGVGATAVNAPLAYPYYPTQITGILGGMLGAAAYEEVSGFPGKGQTYMLSQSAGHIVVILFILVGNVAFFLSRRRSRRGGEGRI